MSQSYQVIAKLVNVEERRSIDEFAFFIMGNTHKEAYDIAQDKARRIFHERISTLEEDSEIKGVYEINIVIFEKPPDGPGLLVPGRFGRG